MLLSGTGTLTAIATFNGVDGYDPASGLADAKGDIFGDAATTPDGGNTFGPGVVFEIPAGTSTIKDIVTFPAGVFASVTAIDSSGDLFGFELGATNSDPGTVIEIPAGTSTITPLATFPSQSQQSVLGLFGTVNFVDSAGDVFGEAGVPFEVVKGSGTVTPLLSQNNGGGFGDMQLGPDGNLYGLTAGQTEIAELSPTTGNLTVLATIDPTTIGTFPQGIAVDSSGNIWGLMQYGGSADMGSVFELPAGSNTVSLIGSFTAATGDTPIGAPVFDASGNLYGLTTNDGANGDGTLFEIPAGKASAGPVDLVDLNDTEQVSAGAGFVTNSAGIAPAIDSGIAGFGGLFSLSATASAATGDVHADNSFLGEGAFWDYVYNPPGSDERGVPRNTEFDWHQQATEYHDERTDFNDEATEAGFPPGSDEVKGDQAALLINRNASEPALVRATPQAKLSAPFEQIFQMLATCEKELNVVAPLVKKQTSLTAQFNKEETTITGLEAKLAAQTKASSKAKIQKTITADTAAQTKVLNHDYSVYDTVNTQQTAIGNLEANIQTALNALPA